ncbi:MAG: CvpA family protein [Deltaproteobacteria bacterium]|nr:CvpA family protein [Deltaproteobacteria bacterium]
MNLLDIAILIVVILITVRGFFRGIIQEAATLVGVIVSFFMACYYYGNLARTLQRFLPGSPALFSILAFIILFGLSLFLFHVFGLLLKKVVHFSLLGWADRVLGGFFGLLKAGVLVFILVTLLTLVLPKTNSLLNNSRLFPWAISLTDHLTLLIPTKIKDDFYQKKQDFLDFWSTREKKIKGLQRYPDRETKR